MANFAGLERAMERCMDENWLAGYSVYISPADEPLYVRYAGYADLGAGIPIQENTLFRTMSMAKPMTAAAAMALVERGKLRLNDPIRNYVPCTQWVYDGNGGKMPLPADKDLTVLHLCNHTNGLGMSDAHMGEIFRATEGRDRGLAMWAKAAAEVPLEFLPGTRTGYSSYIGFTLLGHVLEVAADMPFRDVLQTYLHGPLGMEPPKFHLEAGEMPRLSRLYDATDEGLAAVPQNYFPSPYPEDINLHSGAGGLFMTLGDGARFAGMLAGAGTWDGVRVFKAGNGESHDDKHPGSGAVLRTGRTVGHRASSVRRNGRLPLRAGQLRLERLLRQQVLGGSGAKAVRGLHVQCNRRAQGRGAKPHRSRGIRGIGRLMPLRMLTPMVRHRAPLESAWP